MLLGRQVHLWHYASLDERMAVRTRALADEQWPKTGLWLVAGRRGLWVCPPRPDIPFSWRRAAVAETAPFLDTMHSKALTPASWSPLQ